MKAMAKEGLNSRLGWSDYWKVVVVGVGDDENDDDADDADDDVYVVVDDDVDGDEDETDFDLRAVPFFVRCWIAWVCLISF